MTAVPLIGFGKVSHIRVRPTQHAFVYPTYFLMLPMRTLGTSHGSEKAVLARNRRAALSFYDCDHGDGRGPEQGGALAWLDELLARHGHGDATGEAWLHCYPRVFGYAFKPVSFWYCHDPAGALRAIVVEVNNTFGERHCYLLDEPAFGVEQQVTKLMHVSPFCNVSGTYAFRFFRNAEHTRTRVRIDHADADGPLLNTSVGGTLVPLDAQAIRRALWRYPAMTFGLIARIHWQAARLWFKGVPFRGKPTPPAAFVSR